MSNNIDTNVDNYTISELMAILDLGDDQDDIENKSNKYIQKFQQEGNKKMENFFQDIQNKLLSYSNESQDDTDELNQQTQDWFQNQSLPQSDLNQSNKVTNRTQKIDVYGNNHVPMNRQELGVSNTVNLPVSQDVLNPNLKNVTESFINLDSQFRQSGMSATDYTLDLSDHLNDVISLRLFSFQIPVTWYIIDSAYGNTCFWIIDGSYNIPISIESGNYDSTSLVSALNDQFNLVGFVNYTTLATISPVSYNSINAKITIDLSNLEYKDVNTGDVLFQVTSNTKIMFFDFTARLTCQQNCINKGYYINKTLGWLMGYRLPYINVDLSGNVATAVLDLIGPKYLIIVIDDYNQNHMNNGLVSITELSKKLKLPTYYSADLPYTCVSPYQNINTVLSPTGDVMIDKMSANYSGYQKLLPSAPRTLTQSQLYTINEIIKNNDQTSNFRAKAPTTTDVFALIPVKNGLSLGSLYTELSGSLQNFKRTYFGPVNIDRLRVTLQDDKGNILNLNGAEWSITLISENLYQY